VDWEGAVMAIRVVLSGNWGLSLSRLKRGVSRSSLQPPSFSLPGCGYIICTAGLDDLETRSLESVASVLVEFYSKTCQETGSVCSSRENGSAL
jgi:hypothetical protein